MQHGSAFSARVELTLRVGEEEFELSHIGDRNVVIRRLGAPIPPGTNGTVVITVDGNPQVLNVCLPHGASAAGERVSYF